MFVPKKKEDNFYMFVPRKKREEAFRRLFKHSVFFLTSNEYSYNRSVLLAPIHWGAFICFNYFSFSAFYMFQNCEL